MSENLRTKLRLAQRRLNVSQAISIGIISLTACLLAACVLLSADRLLDWNLGWERIVGGSVLIAVIATAIATFVTRRRALDAALVIDRECHLKERLSTLLSLSQEQLEEPAALALAQDVEKRSAAIDISKALPIRMPRWGWLPAVPAVLLVAIATFVGPLDWSSSAQAQTTEQEREQIAEQAQDLARRIQEREKELPNDESADALRDVAAQIEKAAKEIKENKKISSEEAALKLGELTKKLEQRREESGGLEKMKDALSNLNAGEQGLASRMTQALREGDFAEAARQMEKLKEAIEKGNLSDEEKQKLAQQLSKLEEQMKKAANLAERAKQLQQGLSKEEAQKQLDKLAENAKELKKLDQLADKLGQCSKCLGGNAGKGTGKGSAAAGEGEKIDAELGDLSASLGEAQQMLDDLAKEEAELSMLDQMLDDVGDCRGGMCKKDGKQHGGRGIGSGHASGERPEQLDPNLARRKNTAGQVTDGKSTIVGKARGPVLGGESSIDMQQAVTAAAREADDALTRQPIPTEYKEHTRDYFEKLHGQFNGKQN